MRQIAKPTTKPRGRKPKINPALDKALGSLKVGAWVVLDTEVGGKITDESKQSSIGQTIRSSFKRLHTDGKHKVTVSWSPEGDCQVVMKAAK